MVAGAGARLKCAALDQAASVQRKCRWPWQRQKIILFASGIAVNINLPSLRYDRAHRQEFRRVRDVLPHPHIHVCEDDIVILNRVPLADLPPRAVPVIINSRGRMIHTHTREIWNEHFGGAASSGRRSVNAFSPREYRSESPAGHY